MEGTQLLQTFVILTLKKILKSVPTLAYSLEVKVYFLVIKLILMEKKMEGVEAEKIDNKIIAK